jgi:hypothetical protein
MDKSRISMGDFQWYLGCWDSNHGGILTICLIPRSLTHISGILVAMGRCVAWRDEFSSLSFFGESPESLPGKPHWINGNIYGFRSFRWRLSQQSKDLWQIYVNIWLFWTGYVWCSFWTFKVWNVTIKKNISSKPSWIFYQWAIVDWWEWV